MISPKDNTEKVARPYMAAGFGVAGIICIGNMITLTGYLHPIWFTWRMHLHFLIVFWFAFGFLFLDLSRELYFKRSGREHWFRPFGEAGLIASGLFMAGLSTFVFFIALPGISITNPALIYGVFVGLTYLVIAVAMFAATHSVTIKGTSNEDQAKTLPKAGTRRANPTNR
jgi:energy-coupling factor transporter transmembrane protein EcfT